MTDASKFVGLLCGCACILIMQAAGGGDAAHAQALRLASPPILLTCPVGSCPPAASPQVAFSALSQYAVSQKVKNWEIGAVFGLLDVTGGRVGQANDHTDGAKMGVYVGLMQTKSAGPGWALNTNIIRNAEPGGPNSFKGYAGAGTAGPENAVDRYSSTIGYELDLSNFDQDSNGLPPKYPFVVGEYITTSSMYTSWAGLFYGIGQGQHADAWHDGIFFSSPNSGGGRSAADNTVLDLSNSDVGYHSSGVHALAGWYDESAGKYGIWITGKKSIEDIDLSSVTPVGIAVNGRRQQGAIHLNTSTATGGSTYGLLDTGDHGSGESYLDQSHGQTAVSAAGHYSTAAFSSEKAETETALTIKPGQKVCFDHGRHCLKYESGYLKYVIGGVDIMSIDDSGNMSIKGYIRQNTHF